MKIGLVSKEFVNENIRNNVDIIIETMNQNKNLDLILFPESFVQGFDGIVFNYEKDKNIALSVNGPIIKELQNYCNKTPLGLRFGYIELDI